MSLPFNLRFDYSADTARRDLVAGATVAAIAIPQAMAYALIAGVDPRFGLYSAIVVTLDCFDLRFILPPDQRADERHITGGL